MTSDPSTHPLRYAGDVQRAEQLIRNPAVQQAIERRARKPDPDVRRELLGNALRLTRVLAPAVVELVERCRGALAIATPVEVYVYPSPQFNAGCTAPDKERVYMLLSSSLVDGFDADELTFVVGHELGHHLFEHHGIPAHALLDGAMSDPRLALDLFAWQRCAEISADRAGLACAAAGETGDPLAWCGRAMFKLTSGLAGSRVTIDLAEFLHQAGDLAKAEVATEVEQVRKDWFTTHPFSPLRVRALQLSTEGPPYGSARSAADVDLEVGDLLAVMEPRYTSEQSDAAEAMRRLLFAAGIAIAAASGDTVGEDERAALEQLLGPGGVPSEIDVASVREVLAERIARVRDVVPPLRRHQVVRDLCVIARADGRTSPAEEAVLVDVATGIGLPKSVIATWLEEAGKPLD